MPQEFHVLRCYSCGTFQVHIVKKSNKWCCKMCGENQSLKKVYYQGSGKDCRIHVQSLNEKRMMNDLNQIENVSNDPGNEDIEEAESYCSTTLKFEPNSSKWCRYLPVENQLPESDSDTSSPYTFERPNKTKFTGKKRKPSTKNKNNDDYENTENRKKKIKNDNYEDEDIENNLISKYNSDQPNINSDITKQQLPEKQSKWSSFVTETDEDSVNYVNTPAVPNEIFNSTDLSSLDDILDL